MELKFENESFISTKILGFNRTFMELKFVHADQFDIPSNVLIVPLWN